MIANPNDGNSPRVEAATPIIDVSAEGLITATTEQEAGYVAGGSKSATQQLPTQGAATIMPGTTDQTAVASGRYTTGDVKVAGDANLKAENIAEGVSIFGVQGTHSGGVNIEACSVTISIPGSSSIYYTNTNLQSSIYSLSFYGEITDIAKNTLLVIDDLGNTPARTDYTRTKYGGFVIDGDGAISVIAS